jgi:RND family efflux transporter MFP subunit
MKNRNLVFLGLVVVAIMQGCSVQKNDDSSNVTLVKVAEIVQFTDKASFSYPGKIKASEDVNLAFRVSGPIKKVLVKEGQFVRKGDVIALMDPRDYEIQLEATTAEYEQVKAEAERVIELHKRNSIANKDYDKAVAGLHRIEAKLKSHRNALHDTRLTASFSGYVQKIYFDSGEIVKAGLPIVRMVNTSLLEVEAFISARDYSKKDCFSSYSCKTDIYPGVEIPLSLNGVSPKANLNQLFKVSFTLDKSDSLLLSPGMSVDVNIVCTGGNKPMFTIPVSALFSKGNESFVWLYDANSKTIQTEKVNVMKLYQDGTALVTGDLTAGHKVVSAGVHSLKEGQEVKLLKPVSKTNVGGLL